MAAPTYKGKGAIASSGNNGIFTFAFPTVAVGDLIVVAAMMDAGSGTIDTADSELDVTQFTVNMAGDTFSGYLAWKLAVAGDSGATISIYMNSGNIMRAAQAFAFSGVNSATLSGLAQNTGNTTTCTIPAISVTNSGNHLGVSIVCYGDNILSTATGGWTEISEDSTTAGNDGAIVLETKSITGPTTEASHPRTYAAGSPYVAFSFYLAEPTQGISLTPSLFNNGTDTFDGPAVTSNRALTAARYDNSTDTFYAPTVVRRLQQLTASLYDNSTDTFQAQVLKQQQRLTAALFDNSTDTFYAPKLGWGLRPSLYSDGDTFHAPTITTLKALTAALFDNGTDTFYAPTVANLRQLLTASLFNNGTDTFYAPTVEAFQTLTAARFDDSADTIYAPTARANKNLTPSAMAHTNIFYAQALVKEQFLTMSHVMDPADAFFVPQVKGFKGLTAARFDDSTDTFYGVIAYAKKDLAPPTIGSTTTFNQHAIGHFYLLIADLFADGDTFYTADISAPPVMGQYLTPERVVNDNVFPSALVQRVGDFVASERDTTHLARNIGLNLVHALRLELHGRERVQYLGSLPADALITGTIVHVIEGFGSGTNISAGYDALYANVISPTASHTGRVISGGPVAYQYSKTKTLYARLHGDTIDPNGRASVIVHYVPGAE